MGGGGWETPGRVPYTTATISWLLVAEGAPTTPHLGNIGIGVVYANSFLISSSVNGAGEDGGTETTGGAGGLNNSFIAFCRWNFMRLLIIKGSSGAEFMPSCSGWLACWLGKGKFCCALLQPISEEDEGTFGKGPPPSPLQGPHAPDEADG